MASQYPNVFDLTSLTGERAGENRTTVVANIEMKPRTRLVLVISVIPAVLVAFPFTLLVGPWGLLVAPVVMGAAHILFNVRSNDGLRRRYFQKLLDKRKSSDGEFTLCWEPLVVNEPQFEILQRVAAPMSDPEVEAK